MVTNIVGRNRLRWCSEMVDCRARLRESMTGGYITSEAFEVLVEEWSPPAWSQPRTTVVGDDQRPSLLGKLAAGLR